jgi:hypothetical protein
MRTKFLLGRSKLDDKKLERRLKGNMKFHDKEEVDTKIKL